MYENGLDHPSFKWNRLNEVKLIYINKIAQLSASIRTRVALAARYGIMGSTGYPFWGLAYTVFFLILAAPFWLQGEVVAPHRMSVEIAATDRGTADYIENRKFNDYSNAYVPEVTALHQGPHSGWLALWTNESEFGRPLYHLSGFSPAYPPIWVLSQFVDSPYRLLTILTLANCFFAGLFILLWCREVRLTPLAGFVSASILATSPLFIYWLTFPMFAAVWCWSAAMAWALARMARQLDPVGWIGLTLATHSILLTAYPQPIVYQAYLLAGYALYLIVQRWREGGKTAAVSFAWAACAALLTGVILAAPVYADLIHTVSESARLSPDTSFFTSILPKFDSLQSVAQFIVLATIPDIFGNPISPAFGQPYDGLTIPLLAAMLAWIAFITRLHQSWGWWLAVCLLLALTIWPGLFAFAVSHMGFNLSRSAPQGSILLPMTLICAYGADALIRREPGIGWPLIVTSACGLGLTLVLFATIFALTTAGQASFAAIALALTIVALFGLQIRRKRSTAMLAAALISATVTSHQLMLCQIEGTIATRSPLIMAMRSNLPAGTRYAIAAPGLTVLPPNLSAAFGLASIHSYNSLSPMSYHEHLQRLGGKTISYGRLNRFIDPDYASLSFWMSNIGLVLAPHRLDHPNLSPIKQVGTVHLHRVVDRMGCCRQIDWADDRATSGDIEIRPQDLIRRWSHEVRKSDDAGDSVSIDTASRNGRTLLILSQKYHRAWRASVQTRDGVLPAETARINGFFQGVLLPERTTQAVLEFRPFARFSWGGHLFWFCAILGLITRWSWRNRTRKTCSRFKAIEA